MIAGKYRVERVLGMGGMGVVVAAEHTLLKQRVALKFVLDTADAESTDRFMREARATARLESEHVCRVMDVGTTEDGAPYIVMEMLAGMDLSARITAFGPAAVSDAVGYVLQLLDALAEAHARGIVHRDLKPSNLFLASRGDGSTIVKVLDFGISKLQTTHEPATASTHPGADGIEAMAPRAPAANGLTATGAVMGSPPYMSPEQLRSSRDVDARSDIWAVGAILYELVTGARAFSGSDGLFGRILLADYPAMRAVRTDVPEELERIVARCLCVDPGARYANAAELAQALAPLAPDTAKVHVERAQRWGNNAGPAAGGSLPAPAMLAGVAASEAAPTVVGFALPSSREPSSLRKRWTAVTIAAAALAAVALVVAFTAGAAGLRRGTGGSGAPTVPSSVAAPVAAVEPAEASSSSSSPAPPPTEPDASVAAPVAAPSGAASARRLRPKAPPRTKVKPNRTGDPVDLGRL